MKEFHEWNAIIMVLLALSPAFGQAVGAEDVQGILEHR